MPTCWDPTNIKCLYFFLSGALLNEIAMEEK